MDFENMTWSYSRLNSYYNCKWAWKQTYMNGIRGDSAFFNESGSLMHQVLEDFANDEVYFWDLSDHYEALYRKFIKHKAPYNKYVDLEDKRRKTAHDYLDSFTGFDEVGEIVGVEKEIFITIDGKYKMVGYIDLLLTKDGDYIILDHKSISDVKKNQRDDYFKQLYVYSKAIFDEFGVNPTKLILNQFNVGELLVEEFNIEMQKKALDWCLETIELIKKEDDWDVYNDSNQFFCMNLCGMTDCKHKVNKYKKKK